jgi:hypothetical protein
VKTLTLNKLPHVHVIRYEPGEEALVLDALIGMVNDTALEFDWFDASVLSHQLGQDLAKELKAFIPKA